MRDMEKIKTWVVERDKALTESIEQESIDPFVKFYNKYLDLGIYRLPLPADNIVELSIYKSALECTAIDRDVKFKAFMWLVEKGHRPLNWEG